MDFLLIVMNLKNMKKIFPTKVKRVIAVITTLLLIIALNMGSSKAGAGNYLAYNLLDKSNTLNTSYTPQNHFGGTAYSSPAFDFHIFAEEVTRMVTLPRISYMQIRIPLVQNKIII
mgnify:CR=1 FL=1